MKAKTLTPLYLLLIMLMTTSCGFAQKKQNVDSVYLVARQYAFDNEYDKALDLTNSILEYRPDFYEASILNARIYAWQGDRDRGIAIAKAVISKDPKNYDAYNALSSFYIWKDEHTNAIATINTALKLYPDDVNLLIKKTKSELALKDYDEAKKDIAILTDLDPNNQTIKNLAARIDIESTHGNSINLDSIFNVAREAAFAQDYRKSLQEADKLLKVYPDYLDAKMLKARVYAWSKKYDLAEAEAMSVLDKDPQNLDALHSLAVFYFWQEDYAKSLTYIDLALKYYPNNEQLLEHKLKLQNAIKDDFGKAETLKKLQNQ